MKPLKIKYYNDPGHGWCAVKVKLLKELGIADRITYCSYIRGATAYLEEDCDAGLLVKTLQEKGIQYTVIDKYTNRSSPIRSYERYIAAHVASTIQQETSK